MRIATILTVTAALALPATAFATPKDQSKPAPTAPAKARAKHHLSKTKPADKPIASPTQVAPTPANPPMAKSPTK